LVWEAEKAAEGNKMPQLSDLRESGRAGMRIWWDVLYRPEYYDITANELGESNKGETYKCIATNIETGKLWDNG